MDKQTPFSTLMRQQYPEGLTGIIAVGGTRTTYILEHNRHNTNPGHIADFEHYADNLLGQYLRLATDFFDLGGQNLIMPVLAYQLFHDRGQQYMQYVSGFSLRLIEGKIVQFYKDYHVDPFFTGVDTLIQLPEDHPGHMLGQRIVDFCDNWDYEDGRYKLVWEIAPVPLFSFWNAQEVLGDEAFQQLKMAMNDTTSMGEMQQLLYRYYARAVYGTDIPYPHFYIGANRNGDLKLRAVAPIALLNGGPFRLFFTPYPSLFMTREVLQAILEDLTFGKTMRSSKIDYDSQYTAEMAQAEYERVMALRDDPKSVLGLTRYVEEAADVDE